MQEIKNGIDRTHLDYLMRKNKHNAPYTIGELNRMVEQYRVSQGSRVHNYRMRTHTDEEKKSTKTDQWDLPLTVCSCGSLVPPFIAASGRNCSALKEPHSVLLAAYGQIKDASGLIVGSIQMGHKPNSIIRESLGLKGEDSFDAGRCAEPHAAHRLMNESGAIKDVSAILFSVALDARYPIAKPYCVTCRCVFPQLR